MSYTSYGFAGLVLLGLLFYYFPFGRLFSGQKRSGADMENRQTGAAGAEDGRERRSGEGVGEIRLQAASEPLGRKHQKNGAGSGEDALQRRYQQFILLLLSAAFLYLAGGFYSVFFLSASILISYFAAICMSRLEENGGAAEVRKDSIDAAAAGQKRLSARTAVYLAAVSLQLLQLICFKYLDFPGYTRLAFSELTGGSYEFEPLALLAPLGVSFYALMQISYLTDVWRGTCRRADSLLEYGSSSALFLHIVQGPIDRFSVLRQSFAVPHQFSAQHFAGGLYRLCWGLFKKLVISERLAVFVNTIYADLESFGGSYLVFAAACYALQLYTDFSGCMDLVLGVGELFGLRLSENFKQPFFARSDAEFWRRWHISLGNWFKDYLMYPLLRTALFRRLGKFGKRVFGKKQGKKLPVCLALFLVWSLLGLWHGGMWTFIIGSGLLHCAYMISAELFEPLFERFYRVTGLSRENKLWRMFQILRTFVLVSIGFVFFRSDSLSMAFGIFRGMGTGDMGLFTKEGFSLLGMSGADAAVLAAGLCLLLCVSLRLERTEQVVSVGAAETGSAEERLSFAERLFGAEKQLSAASLSASSFLFLSVLIFGYYGQGYDASAFIYSQF